VEVTVVVATFGADSWTDLAYQRAIPSARAQGVPVVYKHSRTLADARNGGLALVDTEYVIHLDADDELEPGYVDALQDHDADILAPSVAYVRRGRRHKPVLPRVAGHRHLCTADCLPAGNWLVVGAAVRAELARIVGGWRDYEWSEDWDLWLRCHLAGATIEAVPAAVYRAHVRADSRNRAPSNAKKLEVHSQIHRACMPWLYSEAPA
jgi:glycosyltransferase involved in cell wall biosynthesis